jgi:hypothetical protein
MKICPRWQKSYTDDNLNFCLEDGTTLQQMAAGAPPPTVQMNPPVTSPNAPGQPAWNTPQQQYGGPQAPKKSSKTWLWVLLILVLLVVLCGGGFGLLAIIGYKSEQGKNERIYGTNNSTTPSTKTSTFSNKPAANTSANSNSTTSSTSSRTDETDLDLNMFVQKFSIYGNTEIEGDELMVKANSGIAYYVLAAPDDYPSEAADTRVTVRNTTGGPCARGYGLVFHSNPTPLQQGYAFLIDTKRGKYAVVHHEPGKESSVIGWTASTAINPGTAENTLEIRDHDKTVDLYINGTKVNSITNTYGYAGGVPGLYVGQGVKVAFKDFQIRR